MSATASSVAKSFAWEVRIGLEIHAQITTASKLFSVSSVSSMLSAPNTCVSLFDAAVPGTLPRLNRGAVNQALRAATALHCSINRRSYFERKHYFYQDLPLGYQITQQACPMAESGRLDFDVSKSGKFLYKSSVGITRLQLEQDSGKSLHNLHKKYTLVDLNRAGTGLLEIVFAPDLRSPDEAASALRAVQRLLRHVKVCDGNMQDGSMRCDVNVSVAEPESSARTQSGSRIVGNRVEVKNVNSISMVAAAAEYEVSRHISILEGGGQVERETRAYDAGTNTTRRLRSKETAVDYRVFPDPDLPPLLLSESDIAAAAEDWASSSVEFPEATAARLQAVYGLDSKQVEKLITHQATRFFEDTLALYAESDQQMESPVVASKIVFNWMFGDLMANLNASYTSFDTSPVGPKQLLGVINLNSSGDISGPQAKTLLKALFDPACAGIDPKEIVERNGWKMVSNDEIIRDIALKSIRDPKNEKVLKKYMAGNMNMKKFFFGEVMKLGKGQVDPKRISGVLDDVLSKECENNK